MNFKNMFQVIETHTVGQPTRTVTAGLPPIPGDTIEDKMLYLREHADWIRRIITWEPRGSDIMSGVLLLPPCRKEADFGAIFIEVGGYLPMCGHDTIGCCTAVIEAGLVTVTEPYTMITLDTPVGLVHAKVRVENGHAESVTFENIPSFVMLRDGSVDIAGIGAVRFDVAYGGNTYAIVSADACGLTIEPTETKKIIACGEKIRQAINEKYDIRHPEKDFIRGVTHVEFYTKPKTPGADCRNAVVIPDGSLDRSPCGTGSSAKIALLHERGELAENVPFVHESIIGSLFTCRVKGVSRVGETEAVIPEITGSAYVMGLHTLVVDPRDPFQEAFQLR